MRSTDRPDFERHVAALLAGFDRKNTTERIEAYWRGCMTMPLGVFERAVDRALSENGPDEIPTPKRMWLIARELRAAAVSTATSTPEPPPDPLHRLGMSCLSAIVKRRGVPSHASERLMIDAKNRILEQLRESYGDRQLTEEEAEQLRDVVTPACDKHWQVRSAEETAADIEKLAGARGLRARPHDQVQTSATEAA